MVGGGLFHFSVDITFENKRLWPFPLNDPYRLSIEMLKENLDYTNYHSGAFLLVSILILIAMFVSFNQLMKKADQTGDRTKLNVVMGGFLLVFIAFFVVVGSTGEPDLGALVYFSVFYFTPFALALFSFHPLNYEPQPKEYDDSKGKVKLKIAIGYFVLLGLLLLSVAVVLSIDIEPIVSLFLDEDVVREIITDHFSIIVAAVYAASVFIFWIAYLLWKKKSLGQRLASFVLVVPGIIILISLVVWGLLREKEVVELFN